MFRRLTHIALASTAVLVATGCQESTASSASALSSAALAAALSTVPVGYGDLSSSYVGIASSSASSAGLWVAGGREASFNRGDLMGGGLQDAFAGGIAFTSRGGNHGPFAGGLSCTTGRFDAATGRVVCAEETHNGVVISRSARYTTTSGTVQQAFDSLTTNAVNVQTRVAGAIVFNRAADSASTGDKGKDHWGRGRGPGGRLLGDTSTVLMASTTIASSSDRTVVGLAAGSTQRTVNGTSAGQESTTGTSSRGSFTATRAVGDTTTGVIVPVVTGTQSYPTAGTVIRSITASLTYAGETPVTLNRREVITYDGSATARIVITLNGVTQSCTRALPRGALSCS